MKLLTRSVFCIVLCISFGLLLSACQSPTSMDITAEIDTGSSPIDMLSGNNTLLRIRHNASNEAPKILLNGTDVSSQFKAAASDKLDRGNEGLVGRLENLQLGDNTVEIFIGGQLIQSLTLSNHSSTGPVFSGPQQQPFVCQNEINGLAAATDESCSAPTVVSYVYKSTEIAERARSRDPMALPSGFKEFDPRAPRPADLAQTTTSEDKIVDYVVRLERGVINRSVYEIAMLHTPGSPLPNPWAHADGWNSRLVYSFGGGCAAGYRQGILRRALNDRLLRYGYAVAAGSLNTFGNNCDDVISAETAMMVKEHFVEQFGIPVHTIGYGGSGGSMQQHMIAQNYPGILDGITPSVSYPEHLAVWSNSADCHLLNNAFKQADEQQWSEEQKRAVSGFATWEVCERSWANALLESPLRCNDAIPEELHYDKENNPKGARCSIQDTLANYLGRDPKTGHALAPLDNVGVQYGLAAFNAGQISAEQFLWLNKNIGGFNQDGEPVAKRTLADRQALDAVYQKGRINSGAGDLGRIPIIDSRIYSDPTADIHDSYRSFVIRARIQASNKGRAENQVILRSANKRSEGGGRYYPFETVPVMDQWLDTLALDTSNDDIQTRLARAKPAELVDACWDEEDNKIAEPQSFSGQSRCNSLYPLFSDPRIVAGAPLTDDVLKCQLKPVDPADYSGSLTAEQMGELKTIFASGVCDYSKPGVGQVPLQGTWLKF